MLIKSHLPSVLIPAINLRKHSLFHVCVMGWFRSGLPFFFNCNARGYMKYRHDVFISFRGPDVRKGFADHLNHALKSAGFRPFLDSHHLKKGDDISAGLRQAIEESHILIPIFSTKYADSAWCLREASLIARQVVLQRQGKGSAIAIPLFYDVTPSQVRRPEQCGGPFAEAFEKHASSGRYSPNEISEWKSALFELCRISGWTLQEDTNGYEAVLVKRVVEEVAQHCTTGCRT